VAEHPEVPGVKAEAGETLGEAPMRMGAQLRQQEAGTTAQLPRRGCLLAGAIFRHGADGNVLSRTVFAINSLENSLSEKEDAVTTVSVRYITDDVDAAVAFYTERLGFNAEMRPGPGFAVLSRGDLRLLLNQPGAGGAGQPMPDGRRPEPGGWNRIQLEVSNLEREVEALREAGASFRNEIVTGRGGSQILLEDPAGNPIELFQPAGS
jgi:catechol 2,3-dioxygenase-like lactoylglutathione lyase family enzyme